MSNDKEKPGDGLRSMRSTTAFRVINFELYAKPVLGPSTTILLIGPSTIHSQKDHHRSCYDDENIVIMSIGLTCFGLTLGYIAYMRHKAESMGYYSAIDKDGKEIFEKKKSKWD